MTYIKACVPIKINKLENIKCIYDVTNWETVRGMIILWTHLVCDFEQLDQRSYCRVCFWISMRKFMHITSDDMELIPLKFSEVCNENIRHVRSRLSPSTFKNNKITICSKGRSLVWGTLRDYTLTYHSFYILIFKTWQWNLRKQFDFRHEIKYWNSRRSFDIRAYHLFDQE